MSAQRGFMLLELLVAALILTLLAVWGSNALVRRLEETAAQGSAVWMLSVRAATQAYIQRYGVVLTGAESPAALVTHGYASWATPSLVELKADGLLSAGFPTTDKSLGSAAIQLVPQGECPGPGCRLAALVSSAQPLVHQGSHRINEYLVAQWLMAARGLGGWVSDARPESISGAAFHYPNPPVPGSVPLPAGTVALAITSEQQSDMPFLRVGDTRDPDFQGEFSVQGDVDAKSDLRVGGYLRFDSVHVVSSRCHDPHAVSRSARDGLLMCVEGFWQPASRSGGGYSVDALLGCSKGRGDQGVNPVTLDCTCRSSDRPVLISDSGSAVPGGGRIFGFLCVER